MWEIPPRVVLMFKSLLCSPRPTSPLLPSWLNQFTGRTTLQLFHLHRDEEEKEDNNDIFLTNYEPQRHLHKGLQSRPFSILTWSNPTLHGIPPYGPNPPYGSPTANSYRLSSDLLQQFVIIIIFLS